MKYKIPAVFRMNGIAGGGFYLFLYGNYNSNFAIRAQSKLLMITSEIRYIFPHSTGTDMYSYACP